MLCFMGKEKIMEWLQILIILGSNLALFIWARSEARHDQQEIREIIRSIQEEMKDFHGKMERIDAEFKTHMIYYHSEKK